MTNATWRNNDIESAGMAIGIDVNLGTVPTPGNESPCSAAHLLLSLDKNTCPGTGAGSRYAAS